MKTTILSILLASAAAPTIAAVQLRWDVETSRLQPVVFDAVHGESLAFEAAFQSYGTPVEMPQNCSLFYQTNGMGAAWWTAPATVASNRVSATFAPSMDPGASSVSCFLGATGSVYRAAFTIRFRHGPGAQPNTLPLPTLSLDFANVSVTNAPYYTKAETNAKIVELSPPTSLSDATNYTDSVAASTLASANAYTDAAVVSAGSITPTIVRALIDSETGGTNELKAVVATVSEHSSEWSTAADTVNAHSGEWSSAYNSILANGSNWSAAYESILANGQNWSSAYNSILANGQNWTLAYNSILANGANWNSAYNTITEKGTTWDAAATQAQALQSSKQDVLPYPTNAIPASALVESDPHAATIAAGVFAANADYVLTNAVGSAFSLSSGQIGSVTMSGDISLTLDFSNAANRSGDCFLYAINATANEYEIDPLTTYVYVSADLEKALTIGAATTNILCFTRLKSDTVLVSKQEVK